MDGNDIMSPKPFFDMDEEPGKGVVRIKLGSKSNGVWIDISEDGIVFNGYYKGHTNQDRRYACLLKPTEIAWEELDKMRKSAIESSRPKRKKKKKKTERQYTKKTCAAHYDDFNPDEEYLESLPIVTLNNEKFHIDVTKKERRPVKDPTKVYKY